MSRQTVLFVGRTGTPDQHGQSPSTLWETDGTAAGTHELTPISNEWRTTDGSYGGGGLFGLTPLDFISFNGSVLFSATGANAELSLWVTDGTGASTRELTGIVNTDGLFMEHYPHFTAYNGQVLFQGENHQGLVGLWVSDGTAAGTHELTGISGASSIGVGGIVDPDFTIFNGQVLFNGDNNASPNSQLGLWVTNGTGAGTHELTGYTGAFNGFNEDGLNPSWMTVFNTSVLFNGTSAGGGFGHANLWVTNGTGAGTHEVAGIAGANANGLNPVDLTDWSTGGVVLFSGVNASAQKGLWVTDGTAAGTAEVPGISGANSGGLFSGVANPYFTLFNGMVLFEGNDTSGHIGLWETGGAGGTHELTGIAGANSSGIFTGAFNPSFAVFNGQALFTGFNASSQQGLWETDGTAGGTHEVTGIAGVSFNGLSPGGFTTVTLNDDFASSTVTTGTLALGGYSFGNIEVVGDRDWFRVSLSAGTTYVFDMEGSATQSVTLSDPFLRLYNSSSSQVGQDDDSGTGNNARIGYTANSTGAYYLEASEYGDSAPGTYFVFARADAAPTITSNGGGATASVSIAENTTAVTSVSATDSDIRAGEAATVFSIFGGTDLNKFNINSSTGQLSFIAAPDFENPTDSDHNNSYIVTVRATDSYGAFANQTITVNVTNVNEFAPSIISNGAGATATLSVAENTTAVTTVTATDADAGTTLTYSKVGGIDQALFTLNAATGALSFTAAPNFANPADSDHNNSYIVTVRASDGSLFDDQTITVNVTNVNGSITDFNGDGISDVLWFNGTSGTVGDWLMSNGTPTWHIIGQASASVSAKGYGDFNGNRTSDILWENPTNGVVGDWLMSNNVPVWQQIGQGSTTMNIAGVGDFYGVKTDDILWQNPANNLVGEWQMNNNVPTWHLIAQGSTTMNIAGIGDFNGDGRSDILWENPTNNLVGMWGMNGSTATWSLVAQGSTTMQIVGVGDFKGNGTDDVLWENPTNGTVGFWGMNNGQATSWNVVGTANTAYSVAAIADYYGNGTSDILWHNATSGDTGIWAMNNGQATWHYLGVSSTAFSVVKP